MKDKIIYDSIGAINQSRDFTLRKLTGEFLKYGGSPELGARIKSLIPRRNEIAHNGYIWLYDDELKPLPLGARLTKLKETGLFLIGRTSSSRLRGVYKIWQDGSVDISYTALVVDYVNG